jgi:hypothetical protein
MVRNCRQISSCDVIQIFSFRKKRYFILRSDIRELCYYVSEEQLTLIGSIAIDSNTIIWNVNEKDGTVPPISPLMTCR